MTKPLPPGWYPHPNGGPDELYWDGQEWHSEPPPWKRDPIQQTQLVLRMVGGSIVLLLLIVMAWACNHPESQSPSRNSSPARATTRNPSPARATTTTTQTPPDPEYMPGDGTYNMGGIDGKKWGTWESDGARDAIGCGWSIRVVSRYAPAEVLKSGRVELGEKARVDVEPDGDVDVLTGEINGHRIVFVTLNCQPWRWW